jgi:hypothetical protein
MRSLADLGYRPRAPVSIEQLADPAARESWVRDKGLTVFGLWSDRIPGLEVDVFVEEPFAFDEASDRAVSVALDTTTATVVSLPDLVALKRASGRAMDLADLEALEALAAEDGESWARKTASLGARRATAASRAAPGSASPPPSGSAGWKRRWRSSAAGRAAPAARPTRARRSSRSGFSRLWPGCWPRGSGFLVAFRCAILST